MSRLNVAAMGAAIFTHEGGPAYAHMKPEQMLRRSVLSCMLWEDEFYEDGQSIAARIKTAAADVPLQVLAKLALEARTTFKLRHMPLYLAALLAQRVSKEKFPYPLAAATIANVVQRADELNEFLAVYAKINGVGPDKVKSKLSAQVKIGLAEAFTKFDAYQLAKYDRQTAIRLRDVLFMVHAKPINDEQKELWTKLVDGKLEVPDTWEVALTRGGDKKEVFERLLREKKLGYMACLRNLRNMQAANVDFDLVRERIVGRKGADRVLPFRYVAAARAVPAWENMIDEALLGAVADMPRLTGKTVVLVDVSSSMRAKLSGKSDLRRIDAAATLGALCPADQLRVFSFSDALIEVPTRRGMGGIDAIQNSQRHSGTALGAALAQINTHVPYDRIIVITDEQTRDKVPNPGWDCKNAYMVNVASAKNGVGYGAWKHIDGFSEHIFDFMIQNEASAD